MLALIILNVDIDYLISLVQERFLWDKTNEDCSNVKQFPEYDDYDDTKKNHIGKFYFIYILPKSFLTAILNMLL